MVYVVTACANQAEAINSALAPEASYHCKVILPGGEDSLSQLNIRNALATGSKSELERIIKVSTRVFEKIKQVVFDEDHKTVFGPWVFFFFSF